MQDHLFGQQHLIALKTQSKLEGNDSPVENGSPLKTAAVAAAAAASLLKPGKGGNLNMINGFPFHFGMMPGGLPLVFDQSLIGVAVQLLQVPESVKEQIKADMAAGESQTRFTHDGETIEGLKEQLSSEDVACVREEDIEVGWGCPTCGNVFQMEQQLKTHQQSVCPGNEVRKMACFRSGRGKERKSSCLTVAYCF